MLSEDVRIPLSLRSYEASRIRKNHSKLVRVFVPFLEESVAWGEKVTLYIDLRKRGDKALRMSSLKWMWRLEQIIASV